jgi:hypothetical protein
LAIGIAVAGRAHATTAQITINQILVFIFAPSSREYAEHKSRIEDLWFRAAQNNCVLCFDVSDHLQATL